MQNLFYLKRKTPKRHFTEEEDAIIKEKVNLIGPRRWVDIARCLDNRTGSQVRERYINYLSPKVGNDPWTSDDEKLLYDMVRLHGYKWSKIADFFPKRTDVYLKNRWAIMRKRKTRKFINHHVVNVESVSSESFSDNNCTDMSQESTGFSPYDSKIITNEDNLAEKIKENSNVTNEIIELSSKSSPIDVIKLEKLYFYEDCHFNIATDIYQEFYSVKSQRPGYLMTDLD